MALHRSQLVQHCCNRIFQCAFAIGNFHSNSMYAANSGAERKPGVVVADRCGAALRVLARESE